MAGNNIQTSI
uniref:Uncharacterized protein n=1 Tax=Arundo donax TaxID=35708 RepID=A0A0A8YXP4_ARUDO